MNQFTASLWGDEGFSAILSMHSPLEIIRIIINDTSPPLYNLTEWLAFQIFGTDEVVIRSLSFFYYILCIFFVFKITELFWDKKTALLAAVVTFLNPFFFIYAFEGRMYSILALGVTASMYFFVKIIFTKYKKDNISKADKIGYVVATLWALYSHHFAIFALMLQGMWFMYEFVFANRKKAKQIFVLFLITALLYTPWLYPLYLQTTKVGGGFWLGIPDLTDLRELIYDYLAQGQRVPIDKLALYVVFGLIITRKWTININKSALLISWFLFPILATWGISQVFTSIFFNRYLLYAIPAAMVLLVSNRRKYISLILIAFLIYLFAHIDFVYFLNPTKRPFKELATYVNQTQMEGDYTIIWDGGNHQLWETKYYGIPSPIYAPNQDDLPFFVGTALMKEGDIIHTLPQDAQRIGVVTIGDPDAVEIQGYPLKTVKDFGRGLKFIWLAR